MNPDSVQAVPHDSEGDAQSLKEIALAIGLEISSRTERIRAKLSLAKG